MSFALPRAVIFDLDGTLVDSAPDLAASVDHMQRRLGLPERGEAAVRQWVGNGVEKLVKRALCDDLHGEPDAALFERALPLFWAHYAEHPCVHSRLYPGVVEALDWLAARGVPRGVVTNKAMAFTTQVLAALGVAERFDAVVGGDTLAQKKPDPAPLLHALAQLGASADEAAQALMVGDSAHDVLAARRAGLPVVCVPYGYNHGEDIRLSRPDAVVEGLDRLHELFAS